MTVSCIWLEGANGPVFSITVDSEVSEKLLNAVLVSQNAQIKVSVINVERWQEMSEQEIQQRSGARLEPGTLPFMWHIIHVGTPKELGIGSVEVFVFTPL